MKRNYLVKAFVSLFAVAALCSCGEDEKDAPKSKECEIISFAVDGVAWRIDGANITRAYPAGTEATDFTPAIGLSPGATVNPPANEAKNFFTAPGVTYTVTAEDGATTKTYIAKATVEDNNESGAIPDNTLTVVVENGDGFNDKIDLVKAEIPSGDGDENNVILATAAYENGRFTIALPENLGAQYLYGWAHDLREIPACVTVSNPNVKINSTMNLIAYKSDARTGTIRYDVGGWKIFLVYVDGDVSITGSCTAEYTDDEGTFTIRYNYNAHLKTGWNIMYQKETVKTDNSREYELTTIVPLPSLAEKGTIVCPPPGFVSDDDNETFTIVIENGDIYNGEITGVSEDIYHIYPVYIDHPQYGTIIDGSETRYITTIATVPYINVGFIPIILPKNISKQYLQPVTDFLSPWDELTVSNPNVKGCMMFLNADKSGINILHRTEDWNGFFVYADGNISITGSHYEYDDKGILGEVHTYNVHLKKGWNIVYSYTQPEGNHSVSEWKITTQVPAGAKWYFRENSN